MNNQSLLNFTCQDTDGDDFSIVAFVRNVQTTDVKQNDSPLAEHLELSLNSYMQTNTFHQTKQSLIYLEILTVYVKINKEAILQNKSNSSLKIETSNMVRVKGLHFFLPLGTYTGFPEGRKLFHLLYRKFSEDWSLITQDRKLWYLSSLLKTKFLIHLLAVLTLLCFIHLEITEGSF